MNKKLFVLLVATFALTVLQKVTFADFDPEEFARVFLGNGLVVYGSSPAKKIIDTRQYYTHSDKYDAYSPDTSGFVDPRRVSMGGELDIGLFTPYGFGANDNFLFADDFYFSSFLLDTNLPLYPRYGTIGKLSYDDGATRTSDGTAINLGIVYLYTKYATGNLYGYDYVNHSTAAKLDEAFQFLLGNVGSSDTTWTDNQFLDHLVTEPGNLAVWLTPYDLNTVYPSWVDNNYAVYVMNLKHSHYMFDPDAVGQPATISFFGDVLYLVQRDAGGTVPEPSTLIAWSVIGLGLFGAARRKRRNLGV